MKAPHDLLIILSGSGFGMTLVFIFMGIWEKDSYFLRPVTISFVISLILLIGGEFL